VFTGANVPLDDLPGWMQTISEGLPLTHGIEAARGLVDGESLSDVGGLLGQEALVGAVYVVVGYTVLRLMERESRVRASLEVA
jgi:ABC-2 type transport system permease protein